MLKSFLLLLAFLLSFSGQAALLKGRVTDDQGEALPFATLYIRNTSTGTASNEQGYYQLALAPGTYEVVFQYVGYKARVEQVTIGATDVERNVQLSMEVYQMREVEVKASEKDPAYAIVKAAIARRKYHLHEALAYTCRVYTKGMTRLLEVPNRVLGVKINDLKPGIAYLSESVSELRFRQPNRLHERMISSKVSGDTKGFSFNRASRVNFNFYESLLRSPGLTERAFISPLAGNALLFYRYRLVGATQENGVFINKIEVTPIRRNDPAFSGYIYIMDDSWRLHSLDLKLTKTQIEYADQVTVRQTFGPVSGGVWRMLTQKLTIEFDTFGFKGNGFFTTVYSQYQVQPAYPAQPGAAPPAPVSTPGPGPVADAAAAGQEAAAGARLAARKRALRRQQKAAATALVGKKKIGHELMVVEKDANKRDSAYWQELRPIPLTVEEQQDYTVKDSIQVIQESRPYLDSTDRKANRFGMANVYMTGFQYRNSFQRYSLSLDPLVGVRSGGSILQYNTVEGTVVNLALRYRKWYAESSRELSLTPTVRYGWANKRAQLKLDGRYYYNAFKLSSIQGSGGRFVSQLNSSDPITPFWNAFYTLLREKNYLKLYEKAYLSLAHQTEVVNGLSVALALEYADRRPLANATDFVFQDRANQSFTSNVPENAELADASFLRHQALITTLGLQFRPAQRYITRPDEKWVMGSRYPTLRLQYTRAFSGILGSDVAYDKISFSVSDRQELGLVGTSNYNLQVGGFIRKNQVYFMDFRHFAGNQILYAGSFGGFQLLDYYRYSTTQRYLEAHFTHEFNGFIFNKIPLFRRLKWQEVATLNYLNTPVSRHYLELGLGVEHIFKFLRVDFFTGFQSREKVGSGIRLGFGF
jgi:hypothetical protein